MSYNQQMVNKIQNAFIKKKLLLAELNLMKKTYEDLKGSNEIKKLQRIKSGTIQEMSMIKIYSDCLVRSSGLIEGINVKRNNLEIDIERRRDEIIRQESEVN